MSRRWHKPIGALAALWGFGGAFGVVAFAVWRLSPVAVESLHYPLTVVQWAALVGNVLYMLYAEGYRGFQQAFAPRVVARSLYLQQNPTLLRVLLAPLFVVGYFHSSRRRMLMSYGLTAAIICLVVLISYLQQPWRGIVDAGVVAGLVWGLVSMLFFMGQALSGRAFMHPHEVV